MVLQGEAGLAAEVLLVEAVLAAVVVQVEAGVIQEVEDLSLS